MKFIPHAYQQIAIDKILDTPRAGLFLDMGSVSYTHLLAEAATSTRA